MNVLIAADAAKVANPGETGSPAGDIRILAADSLKALRADPPEFDLVMAVDPEVSDHYRFRGYLHVARTASFLDQPFEVVRTAGNANGRRSPLRGYLRKQTQARRQRCAHFGGHNYRNALAARLSGGRTEAIARPFWGMFSSERRFSGF